MNSAFTCRDDGLAGERRRVYLGSVVAVLSAWLILFGCSGGGSSSTDQPGDTGSGGGNSFTDFTDPIAGAMVAVNGGQFVMGCTPEQGISCYNNENPSHSVTLTGYYIGKYEVTQKLWKDITGNNPSNFRGDNLPVEQVSWNDVQTFIDSLNRTTGKKYRLPTEAEWEYAARGGAGGRGYKYSGDNAIGNVAWYKTMGDDADTTTRPVGTKAPNELGIYDMSGNVNEWVSDKFDMYSSDPQTNPTGPTAGTRRVYRGGSCMGTEGACRVSHRNPDSPSYSYHDVGFRLALPSP